MCSLVGTGQLDKGAIFNSEGNSVWAVSSGYNVQPAEVQKIVAAYKDTKDVKEIQGTGFHIAGDKFITIKADDRSIYGKKVCSTSSGISRPEWIVLTRLCRARRVW